MPIGSNGQWYPNVSPKQKRLLDDLKQPAKSRKWKILLSGPRRASKTVGGLHAFAQHGWTCRAKFPRYSMCGRTQTDNADGGAWIDFTETILPEWIAAGFGMEWVTKQKMDGLTHKMYCEVTNGNGGVTRYQLDSVKVENEAERIFKGKRFAGIYVPEMSNFKERRTFDIMEESLRVIGMAPEEHIFIGDTNPSEEGRDSWIFFLFFEFPLLDEAELEALIKARDEHITAEALADAITGLKEMQSQIRTYEFTIDDNPYLSDMEKRAQRAKYAHDKDLLDRYYFGKWVKASGEGIFKDVFRPLIHVIGDPPSAKLSVEPEILLPSENCFELLSGWDIGDVNSSAHIIETGYTTIKNEKTGLDEDVMSFNVLDELIVINEPLPLEEFVGAFVEKMDFWESVIGQKVMWTHISDRSAFERYDNASDSYEYQLVYSNSGGRIELERGPEKKRGSVRQRVNLLRKLLYYNRIHISSKCVQTIEMLQNIKAGRILAVDGTSKFKHAMDSLTYGIAKICYIELANELEKQMGIGKPQGKVHFVNLR